MRHAGTNYKKVRIMGMCYDSILWHTMKYDVTSPFCGRVIVKAGTILSPYWVKQLFDECIDTLWIEC